MLMKKGAKNLEEINAEKKRESCCLKLVKKLKNPERLRFSNACRKNRGDPTHYDLYVHRKRLTQSVQKMLVAIWLKNS